MKFVLFTEGLTEKKAIREFLKRWLDSKTAQPVGLEIVKFEGWPELIKDSPKKAKMHLKSGDVLAVIALLDLYGLDIYPQAKQTPSERYSWAKSHLERNVGDPRFLQFFAVHEVEAWLLSDPAIFPPEVRRALGQKTKRPEEVNFDEPPAKLLDRIYFSKTGHAYKKVTQGQSLFKKLDPSVAYDKCPYLRALLDKMLEIANNA